MPALLSLQEVGYDVGGRTVLEGITLEVDKGEILGVLGLSGSGKTTLLRVIMGLVRPSRGRLILFGEEATHLPEAAFDRLRMRMGLVFQYAALFDSLTVEDNVAFPLREHRRLSGARLRARVDELLALVGMEGTNRLYPAQLSGGMRKRVGIARALALGPELMLYDEPSSGLDPLTAAMIDDLIVHLRDAVGVASVVVSHHVPNVLRIAGALGVLDEGRLVFRGTPSEARSAQVPIVQALLKVGAEAAVVQGC